MQVVWINGPLGVGKTTVAEKLVERLPAAVLYDPELVGAMLRHIVPSSLQGSDYQDIPLWRRLVRLLALQLLADYSRPLVVPMTLVVPAYFDEIVGGLREDGVSVEHVALLASEQTILARVRGSDREEWAATHLARCLKSLADPRFARHVDTDLLTADEVAEGIAAYLDDNLTDQPRSGAAM